MSIGLIEVCEKKGPTVEKPKHGWLVTIVSLAFQIFKISRACFQAE
jgi:hypothetical protein